MQSLPQVPHNQPPKPEGVSPQYVDIQPPPHQQPWQQGCCRGYSQNYNIKAGRATGIIQLLLGIIIIVVNAISFIFGHFGYPNQGQPIAIAVSFVVPSGIIGITTKSRRNCLLIAYLVMSILSTISAIGGVVNEGLAAGVFSFRMVCSGYFFCYWDTFDEAVILHAICAAVLFIEVIVAIVASVYCSKGLLCCQGCCCCPSNDVAATATTTVYYPHGTMTQVQEKPAVVKTTTPV